MLLRCLLVLIPAFATAASLIWGASGQGGSGTWDTNTTRNWYNGNRSVKWPAPGGSNDDAVFAGSPGIVTLAAGG
ncbi:MAG: hypothetical protein KDN05_09520 [Verrucomicrobiae bacterium]|nr:hypothetical protein [Verrucomicrobiae bacterium]